MLLASCSLHFLVSEETLFLRRQIHWITWSSDERRCKSCLSWDTFANDENSHVATNAVYPAVTWRYNIRCLCAHEPKFFKFVKAFSQKADYCFVSVSLLHSAPRCWDIEWSLLEEDLRFCRRSSTVRESHKYMWECVSWRHLETVV